MLATGLHPSPQKGQEPGEALFRHSVSPLMADLGTQTFICRCPKVCIPSLNTEQLYDQSNYVTILAHEIDATTTGLSWDCTYASRPQHLLCP
eukprot:5205306-Amphidinium_carterae.1